MKSKQTLCEPRKVKGMLASGEQDITVAYRWILTIRRFLLFHYCLMDVGEEVVRF
jgi:hypothetical protein